MNMYVVVDRLSKQTVSGFIPCVNDAVAAFSFTSYVRKEESERHIAPRSISLYKVAEFDDSGRFTNTDYVKICDGDMAEEYYGKLLNDAIAQEENAETQGGK